MTWNQYFSIRVESRKKRAPCRLGQCACKTVGDPVQHTTLNTETNRFQHVSRPDSQRVYLLCPSLERSVKTHLSFEVWDDWSSSLPVLVELNLSAWQWETEAHCVLAFYILIDFIVLQYIWTVLHFILVSLNYMYWTIWYYIH